MTFPDGCRRILDGTLDRVCRCAVAGYESQWLLHEIVRYGPLIQGPGLLLTLGHLCYRLTGACLHQHILYVRVCEFVWTSVEIDWISKMN